MRTLQQVLRRRLLHTLPALSPRNVAGAEKLYSPTGFDTAWRSAQQATLDRLNAAVVDTDNETRAPFHIMLATHTKPELAHVFNYASRAYANHLFFSTLTDRQQEPPSVLARRISSSFGDLETLKRQLLDAALNLEGQGLVYLVETERKQLAVITCNNAGTSASYYRREDLVLAGGGSTDTLQALELTQAHVARREQCYNVDLLALNMWQHAYVPDYKFDRRAFVERWLSLVDWAVVDKRLFKGRV